MPPPSKLGGGTHHKAYARKKKLMQDQIQISFLPWAEIKKEIKIGSVCFTPWNIFSKTKINDDNIRRYLERFFGRFRDHHGNTVNTITIVHGVDDVFSELNQEKDYLLRSYVDILILSTIGPLVRTILSTGNPSIGSPCSEHFQMNTLNFIPGEDSIKIPAGNMLHIEPIQEMTFSMPFEANGPCYVDENIIEDFNNFLQRKKSKEYKERIFRSLEWFKHSNSGGSNISPWAKIVMMATAFEILFDIRRWRKKEDFARKIDKIVATSRFKRSKRTEGKKKYYFSRAGCWAWDFYNLRNNIVHGDIVDINDTIYKGQITHLRIADLIFYACIRKIIGRNDIDEEFYKCFLLAEFRKAYNKLGWLKEVKISDEQS